ncbi:hypothetical protein ANN_14464 [Periplaneta americana]|uniref:Uncharacterized protein n=1 Tax=Periplaneta americana TaxID=6978 RepID=A0ABQ8SWD8_PERAM|nr:hypothetical protein ANN_14464 [Periplaneta americana]
MMMKLIRKRKRNWLGHWLRRNYPLKDALEGMVNGRRVRGRRRYQMIDNIKVNGSYTEAKRKAENRKDWRMLDLQDKIIGTYSVWIDDGASAYITHYATQFIERSSDCATFLILPNLQTARTEEAFVMIDNICCFLAFLKAHFIDLSKYNDYLESSSQQLKDAISVIDSLIQKQVPEPVGEGNTLKLKKVLKRNPGFEKMKNVCSILQGERFNC